MRIWGYTACVAKGLFRPGDLAAYLPPDSLVPDTPEFAFLGEHRRIKVRRLRGIYSQGLLIRKWAGSSSRSFPTSTWRKRNGATLNTDSSGNGAIQGFARGADKVLGQQRCQDPF